jgi:hypothetical protein
MNAPVSPGIEARKTQLTETLSTQYAHNVIPLEEYERLVDYINKIESAREVALVEKILAENGTGAGPYAAAGEFRERPAMGSGAWPKTIAAILSQTTTQGAQLAGRGGNFVSILGQNTIVIHEGDLDPGSETALNVFAVMGQIDIAVPANVAVFCDTIPILGDVAINAKVAARPVPGMPTLVIHGMAIMSQINIKLKK